MNKLAAYDLVLSAHPLWSKEAGVELNLVGYKSDPTMEAKKRAELGAAADAYYNKASRMAKTDMARRSDFTSSPGMFGRLIGKKSKFDQAGYDAHRAKRTAEMQQIYKALGPAPKSGHEALDALRAGPKDTTASKLTARMLGDRGIIEGLDTDEAYSSEPRSKYLDDKQLDKIVELYKSRMNRFGPDAAKQDSDARLHKKFLDRAAALKKDPSVKGYRLEWG